MHRLGQLQNATSSTCKVRTAAGPNPRSALLLRPKDHQTPQCHVGPAHIMSCCAVLCHASRPARCPQIPANVAFTSAPSPLLLLLAVQLAQFQQGGSKRSTQFPCTNYSKHSKSWPFETVHFLQPYDIWLQVCALWQHPIGMMPAPW